MNRTKMNMLNVNKVVMKVDKGHLETGLFEYNNKIVTSNLEPVSQIDIIGTKNIIAHTEKYCLYIKYRSDKIVREEKISLTDTKEIVNFIYDRKIKSGLSGFGMLVIEKSNGNSVTPSLVESSERIVTNRNVQVNKINSINNLVSYKSYTFLKTEDGIKEVKILEDYKPKDMSVLPRKINFKKCLCYQGNKIYNSKGETVATIGEKEKLCHFRDKGSTGLIVEVNTNNKSIILKNLQYNKVCEVTATKGTRLYQIMNTSSEKELLDNLTLGLKVVFNQMSLQYNPYLDAKKVIELGFGDGYTLEVKW